MWHKLSLKIMVLQPIRFRMIIKINTDYFVNMFLEEDLDLRQTGSEMRFGKFTQREI